jgi:hypothetical protein
LRIRIVDPRPVWRPVLSRCDVSVVHAGIVHAAVPGLMGFPRRFAMTFDRHRLERRDEINGQDEEDAGGVGGTSCWGPFGDHAPCPEANNLHVDRSHARCLHHGWPPETPTPMSWEARCLRAPRGRAEPGRQDATSPRAQDQAAARCVGFRSAAVRGRVLRARIAVNSRTRPDSTGHNQALPTTRIVVLATRAPISVAMPWRQRLRCP